MHTFSIPDIKIGNYLIGDEHPPFFIAELSGNHNRSLERALKLVELAAASGAHAVKLQTYTAETMTLDHHSKDFVVDGTVWQGRSLYDLYDEAHTPWDWHPVIFKKCKELGIICFSTPFDETAVDFLEQLNVPAYKVASFEVTDLPLIQKIARTGKPTILSTGMATPAEIFDAVDTFKKAGGKDLVLLKCTSTYPATPENTNISTIPHMRSLFKLHIGLSDHTMGQGVPVASIALGAKVIEKHFTTDRKDGGVDSAFSAEPAEFKLMVEEGKKAWQALGKIHYGPSSKEEGSMTKYRRSLYVAEDIAPGEVFTKKNLRAVRPGLGLSPKYYNLLLGKKLPKGASKGTAVSWDLVLEPGVEENASTFSLL